MTKRVSCVAGFTAGVLFLGAASSRAYYRTPEQLITIADTEDAALLQSEIIDYFWAGRGVPANMPARVWPISTPSWIASIGSSNLHHVEKMDVLMDYGMHSYAYLMLPSVSLDRLMIYHHGHDGNVGTGESGWNTATRKFLDRGYAVLMFWMPTMGENSRTAYNVPGRGTVSLGTNQAGHNKMAETLEYPQGRDGSFIRFFVEPIVVGVNYAEANLAPRDVNMMGISGGGCVTHLCAAIDPRIRYSFPTAGSYPLYLRKDENSWGDAEQHWPAMYDTEKGGLVSWLDLYILGGYGTGRGELQLLNEWDSCCFWGTYYREYEFEVSDAVYGLGAGFFDVHPYQWGGRHGVRSSEVDVMIGVLETCFEDSYETDDTCAQAVEIARGETQERSFCPASDTDWASFMLTRTSGVLVETFGVTRDDTELWLYGPDSCTSLVEYDDDGGSNRWSRIERSCENFLEPGRYYIKVAPRPTDLEIQQYFLRLDCAECYVYHSLAATGSPPGAGRIERDPDLLEYEHGSTVVVTAQPNSGYVFDSWGGDLTGSANPATLRMDQDREVMATFVEWIPDVDALHAAPSYTSPGPVSVACSFQYPAGCTVGSLVWRPELPDGWMLSGVAGDGDPEIHDGAIAFSASLSDNPVEFVFTADVPTGQGGSKDVRGTCEYWIEGMLHPATATVMPDPLAVPEMPAPYHSADYRAPWWTMDGAELERMLVYWRAGQYHCDVTGADGYGSGDGDASCPNHDADYRDAPWVMDGTEVNRGLAYWRAGAYHAHPEGPDGFAPGTVGAVASSGSEGTGAAGLTLGSSAPSMFMPGKTVAVELTVENLGAELLSFLVRPDLPAGWTIESAVGDGQPEAVGGEIVWTGLMPSERFSVLVTVRAPENETVDRGLGAVAEYHRLGMVSAGQLTPVPHTLTVLIDTDGDGMPDGWESAHGLPPDVPNEGGDLDRDGATDLAEYRAGTDPGDPASVFALSQIESAPDGTVTLRWSSALERTYQIEAADSPEGPWHTVSEAIDSGGATTGWTADGLETVQYYRVRLQE